MSKLKKDNRKPIQVSSETHAILRLASQLTKVPIGSIVDKLIKEKYPIKGVK